MSYASWTDAIKEIRIHVGRTTATQHRLAKVAGILLPKSLPALVAAVRLQIALRAHLALGSRGAAREDQVEYLRGLLIGQDKRCLKSESHEEAVAWMQYWHLKRRSIALRELHFAAGDLVRGEHAAPEEVDEISSIGGDGTVWLCGRGARAWPDLLELVARAGDTTPSVARLRRLAANRATRRQKPGWSGSKEEALKKFDTRQRVDNEEIEQLRMVIDAAQDEKPIQEFLQARPHILGSFMRGPRRYVLPQVKLGERYVPDFLMADVDSTGPRWVYVEIETPNSPVALKTKRDLEKHARDGLAQVREWREWIQSNLDYANRSRRDGGLGLYGIRPSDEGLVLVGRRHLLNPHASSLRKQISETASIRICTYDWLLEQLEGLAEFERPPAANPFMIRRPREDE